MNKKKRRRNLSNETAVIEREKKKRDRIDFDRLVNSCKYTYGTVHKLDQTTSRHKKKSLFSISVRLFKSKKKEKKYKKKKTTCTYT
jgi:hypothetical protein